jgi:aldose 1-epimerase
MTDQPTRPGDPEWRITADGYEAIISAVGATVRVLTHHGRDLIVPFAADRIRPLFRGATVAPWPNRIAGGRYTFDGREYQTAITEVDRGHALHGLVSWIRWDLVDAGNTRLVLRHDLVAQDGYPFQLRLRAEFEIGPDGLRTRLTAINTGTSDAPYGCCPHPYLLAGSSPLDEWLLTLPASTRLEVDDLLIPIAQAAVDDVDSDFRVPVPIGNREIDHAFTDLRFEDGRAVASVLDRANGTGVAISWGEWGQWVQIHTADRPEPENNRVGLAAEPMSCPPNAFNAGPENGPPTIRAGATQVAEWTISALLDVTRT